MTIVKIAFRFNRSGYKAVQMESSQTAADLLRAILPLLEWQAVIGFENCRRRLMNVDLDIDSRFIRNWLIRAA